MHTPPYYNTRDSSNKPVENPKGKAVATWLYLCCASVFIMAIIGAITRLTNSGLSIVEWKPIMGAIPPMNQEEWQHVFTLYQNTPEFEAHNSDMKIEEFKHIFFWEWFHRLWGRFIGLLYAVPFVVFLFMGRIPKLYLPSFIGFLLLGGAQGLMGWYMVQSGLVNEPAVSHYRLAAHLGLAFLLFGLMYHMALKVSVKPCIESAQLAPLSRHGTYALYCVIITLIWGAFVAGLDAGLIYNSFPMMGEYPWPSEGLDLKPLWLNPLENPATVQFIHRCLAIITALVTLSLAMRCKHFNPSAKNQKRFNHLKYFIIIQVGLGIGTLLTDVMLPIAVAHQAGAMILLALIIRVRYEIPPANFSYSE